MASQLRIIEKFGVRTRNVGARKSILVLELRWGSVLAALGKVEAARVLYQPEMVMA